MWAGGASTLVDDLLLRGRFEVTVLDLAASALQVARERLGEQQARRVRWAGGGRHVRRSAGEGL
jgi:hypothetical protein